ncbi:universal stress protein [uncultured Desulfobacter sp.]|uniref:universal stress protein n=1 Tax=uncultured Desulfobacter sp. TaxID=240139 RepID=UPI002AABEF83|nr:universal stress protein [uncultured Desulfobacter sp.]
MIQKPKRILFASDLSTNMKEVFTHAVSISTLSDAGIIVLHVMEEAVKNAERRAQRAFGETLYNAIRSEQKTGALNLLTGKNVDALRIKQAIAGFLDDRTERQPGIEMSSPIEKILVTESKSVADEITRTAVEEGCDIIVMGCRHQNFIENAIGDNIARKVLKRTSVPVLVVPLLD